MFKNLDDLQTHTRTLVTDAYKIQTEIAEKQVQWTRETMFSGLDLARRSADSLGRFWMGAFFPTDRA